MTIYRGGINSPGVIATGADGALWFTNRGNDSIGRITTTGSGHQLHRHRHQPARSGSRPGPTAPCGSPTRAPTRLDRADHHHRDGHQLHRRRHQRPGRDRGRTRRRPVVHQPRTTTRSGGSPPPGRSPTTPAPASAARIGIAAGPDGALWFTNSGSNSIGRITTAGTVTNYTGPGISGPGGIAAGPDGALWFTNYVEQLDRADHHHRDGHQLHRHRHQRPGRDHGRARRRPVVHQRRTTTRSGGSPPPGRVTNYTGTGISGPAGSRPGPTAPCGSPTRRQQLDRADHHHRDGHQLHRRRHQRPGRDHGRSRRRPVVHQPEQQLDRADHHHRDGHQLHRPRHQQPGRDRGRARRRPVVHQPGQATRSGGSPPPGRSPTTPAPASAPRPGSRPDPTAPCGSPTHWRQLDRPDHHHRDGHQLHRHRHHTSPAGITAGPDGALWFTNQGDDSIGRITTTGTVTNYTDTGIGTPVGITAGPDGALWFTNNGNGSIGRITTTGRSPTTPASASAPPGSRPGPTAPCGSPTTHGNSIGRITTTGTVTNYTGTGISPRPGSPPDPTAPCGSPTRRQLDRADHGRSSQAGDRARRGDGCRGQRRDADAERPRLAVRLEPPADHGALDHRGLHRNRTERLRRVVRHRHVRAGRDDQDPADHHQRRHRDRTERGVAGCIQRGDERDDRRVLRSRRRK